MSSNTTINPDNVLVKNTLTITPITNQPIKNPPDQVFAMQTTAWLNLQAFVADAMPLPKTHKEFVDRYGTFQDEGMVEEAVTELANLNGALKDFGDVATDAAEVAKIGTAPTPPQNDIYGTAIWLGLKIANTSNSMAENAKANVPGLVNIEDSNERENAIKDVLMNKHNGLYPPAKKLSDASNEFSTKLNDYLTLQLVPASNSFNDYLNHDGQTAFNDAKQSIDEDQTTIDELTKQISDLREEYNAVSIGGGVGSVVLSLFPPLFFWGGAALAAGTAHQATALENEINHKNQQLKNVQDDIAKKRQLVADLTMLGKDCDKVNQAATSFITSVQKMADGFQTASNNMQHLADTINPDVLEQEPDFLQISGLASAGVQWAFISVASQNFVDIGRYTLLAQPS